MQVDQNCVVKKGGLEEAAWIAKQVCKGFFSSAAHKTRAGPFYPSTCSRFYHNRCAVFCHTKDCYLTTVCSCSPRAVVKYPRADSTGNKTGNFL